MAYIDYRVGKKISYTPDFDTEVCDAASARALWKIITTGYGVCNGISQVEQYLLKNAGIESEIVNSERHSFLKVKNVEIPRSDGTKEKGDTVVDPTWNLTSQKYGCYPNLFARSYEQIRNFDILSDGTDRKCHKNDKAFKDKTIEIESTVLRKVYTSLGLAKENGDFPIGDTIDKIEEVEVENLPVIEEIKTKLQILKESNPDFDKCQNSTIGILSKVFFRSNNSRVKKTVIDRVYNKNDIDKKANMYIYFEDKDGKETFFVTSPGQGQFVQMGKDEFEQNFDCYKKDLKKFKGKRPWEKEGEKIEKNLEQTSSFIVSEDKEKNGGGRE